MKFLIFFGVAVSVLLFFVSFEMANHKPWIGALGMIDGIGLAVCAIFEAADCLQKS
tara:strand:- start:492 stop:659 length:168 start_codon:yes stop_codon:yes gene_type:complete